MHDFMPYDSTSSQTLEVAWSCRSLLVNLTNVPSPNGPIDVKVVFGSDRSLESGQQYTSVTGYTVGRTVRRVKLITPTDALGAPLPPLTIPVKVARALATGRNECLVCTEDYDPLLVDQDLSLTRCGHVFHKACIDPWLSRVPRCPCNQWLSSPRGTCPDGTMEVAIEPGPVGGHERCGCHTYRILYSIPDGVQGPMHPSPGRTFHGTSRLAYVPTCSQGEELLELLERLFSSRMTLTVGTSLTSGASNSVVWSGHAHHKTVKNGGGAWAFPDATALPRMISECQDALRQGAPSGNTVLQP
jgi:deltex-like protein